MSDTKFTPGPWSLTDSSNSEEFRAILYRPGCVQDYLQIAPAPDAHLIAAAPDLYAALEELTEWARDIAGDITDSEQQKSEDDMIERCDAALARARGEAL